MITSTHNLSKQCKRNAIIPHFLLKETKNIIRKNSLKGGLYSKVVMIQRSILNTKFTKRAYAEYKDQNNESAMNDQNKDENDKDFASVKDKEASK